MSITNTVEDLASVFFDAVGTRSKAAAQERLNAAVLGSLPRKAKLAIRMGAEVNTPYNLLSGNCKIPLLNIAVEKNSSDIVKLLVSAGARLDGKDDYGVTALDVATEGRNKEMTVLLLSLGSDPAPSLSAPAGSNRPVMKL
jgi:ankyrin repeat protein